MVGNKVGLALDPGKRKVSRSSQQHTQRQTKPHPSWRPQYGRHQTASEGCWSGSEQDEQNESTPVNLLVGEEAIGIGQQLGRQQREKNIHYDVGHHIKVDNGSKEIWELREIREAQN